MFDGPAGKETLPDLFDGRSQLLVYHFMFGPDWQEGCPSCSFWADNYNGIVVHLNAPRRDARRGLEAPLEKLEAYKRRMGWSFKWVSSLGSDFNRDYHVSFTPEERGAAYYNYEAAGVRGPARPRASACSPRTSAAPSIHTYSCYSRGLDMLNGAYQLLDLVPKGRDEAGLSHPMAWVRRNDRYED